MKTSAKGLPAISILTAFMMIASFAAAMTSHTQPVLAATQQVFTSSTTWTVPSGVTSVTVLVVAGGGGGGGAGTLYYCGGGGGAGGVVYNASYSVTPGATITVTVGSGGGGGVNNAKGSNGGNSAFGTITATGGGGGGNGGTAGADGNSGGSGGGGASRTSSHGSGGSGTSGQGNNGGAGFHDGLAGNNAAGGGGGKGATGGTAAQDDAGDGGTGTDYSSIFGTSVGASGWFGGGGGGAAFNGNHGTGGTGGGAAGADVNGGTGSKDGGSATANTGGGGGGGGCGTLDSTASGGSGGSGVVIVKYTANSAPTITSITLQQSDKSTATSAMTPQTAYNVEIVAGDADTIDDINQLDIWIFRDDNAGDDGAPGGTWDADHESIYRWAKNGSTWSMQNGGATTTWSITTGSCDTPGNMAATSGEWNLYFTVGKLAQESDGSTSEWDIKITVTDSVSNTVSSTIYSKSMGAYSSLSLSSSTISFGSIALGGTAAIQTPAEHYVILIAISNDTFALGSKSSSPWTNGGNNATLDTDGSPGSGYFSLTQDDAGDGSGHPSTPQYVTTDTATITGLDAVSRTSTSAEANEATTNTNMYMDCILGASGLQVLTYSGTITFTITNN